MELFNSLTFDGVNSLDSGIYITGEAVYNAPQRQVEMITVPGRNGTLAIDQGRFENIEVTYPAGCFADDQSDFAEKVREFRNELASRFGYKRLVDTYHPDEFRLGTYSLGLEVGAVGYHRAGEFDITFDCKPQRFLVSGEETVTIGEWGETETATGDIVEIDNPDGTLGVKSLLVTIDPIQDLNGYDKPWSGGNGKNKVNPDTLEDGYYNDEGRKISDTNFRTSTLISAKGNTIYSTSVFAKDTKARVGGLVATCWDADENVIGQYTVSPFTTPSDTAYIRVRNFQAAISYITSDNFIYQLEEGSVYTDYEPYSNICPISGRTEVVTQRTGGQLINTSTNQSGAIDASGNEVANATFNRTDFIPIDKANICLKTSLSSGYVIRVHGYSASKAWVSQITYVNTDGTDMLVEATVPNGVSYIRVSYPLVGIDNTELWQGDTYTTTLGRTVYGGTLDVVSGELVVDRAMASYDGSETWSLNSTGGITRSSTISKLADAKKEVSHRTPMISDSLVYAPSGNAVGSGFIYGTQSSAQLFVIADQSITTVDAFKAWLADNPITICYELATPQTYQLDPQTIDLLLGDNNVWSDGRVAIEYGLLPNIIVNPTLFASNPLLVVTGSGTLSIGNQTLTIASGSADQVIYIDCDSQEAWEIVGGGKLSRNDYIQNAGESFPVLNPGANNFTLGTGITRVEIVPRWWRI